MRTLVASVLVIVVVAVSAACSSSSGGAVGTACSQSGGAGQCASGAVCGKPSDGSVGLQCLLTCTVQTDCPAGDDCNGVEGSTQKGCRPKSSTADAGKK